MTDAADPLDRGVVSAVRVLGDGHRRRLFGFTRAARRPVTRDEAAAAVGISRKLAAFHLDKLVEAGLLRSRFRAGDPRRVGRRPKVYEPSGADLQISIPARRHEVLADILTQAVLTEADHGSAKSAAEHAARDRGFAAAAVVRDAIRPGRLGPERALTLAADILMRYGFEPDRTHPSCIRLRNCPFHPLAQAAPDLICQLNHAFMRGMIDGLRAERVDAALAPSAGECCVELRANPRG